MEQNQSNKGNIAKGVRMMKILWESIKEPLREIVLAVIPVLLVYFGAINQWWAVAIYIVLRGIDSYLHELGKIQANKKLITGITRF